jgi:hypothetical protein
MLGTLAQCEASCKQQGDQGSVNNAYGVILMHMGSKQGGLLQAALECALRLGSMGTGAGQGSYLTADACVALHPMHQFITQ